MKYEQRVTKMALVPKGNALFDLCVTEVEIVDEAAGEFLEVTQRPDVGPQKISIDREEWPHLRELIDKMIGMTKGGD